MESEQTRPTLLARVRNPEDQAAWREFDAKYRELILRYCRRGGLQASDAEDVRQAVMMSLARSLKGFRYRPDLGSFRHYLGRVVRNAVALHLRRPRRTVDVVYVEELDDLARRDATAVDETWDNEWMQHHYRQAMEGVRSTFEPRSVEMFEQLVAGRTTKEVAAAFDTSTQAVHKVKQRIKLRLQELIAEQLSDEEFPERGDG